MPSKSAAGCARTFGSDDAASVATSVASADGLPNTVLTSTPVLSSSRPLSENAPTSQPARVNGTHGAGWILPFWSTISGTSIGLAVVPSLTRSVQYANELVKCGVPVGSKKPKLLPTEKPNFSP